MTRISRISTPRATLAAFALLVVVMTGLGLMAGGAHGDVAVERVHAATETVEQSDESSHHCWTTALAGAPAPRSRSSEHVHY